MLITIGPKAISDFFIEETTFIYLNPLTTIMMVWLEGFYANNNSFTAYYEAS